MQVTRPGTGGHALVTGASAGIGAEFARQLAARGEHLVITARRAARLTALANELRQQHHVDVITLPVDLAEPAAAGRICTALSERGIEVGTLVNNAGYGVPGHLNTADWSTHRDFLQVMVNAVVELSYRLLPAMRARGSGAIVNVASLAALVPGSPGHTLYAASKAFLVRFSESLALENQDCGVRVQALCPGFTYSEFHDVVGTREVVSQMPDYMWMTAAAVVADSLKQLDRPRPRVVVVPGRVNRFLARLAAWLPHKVALGLMRRRSHRFRARE